MLAFYTNKVQELPINHKLFMTNPCEKKPVHHSPLPPILQHSPNLVGSTEPPRSPCQRQGWGSAGGARFTTQTVEHAREKFSMSKSLQPEEDWNPCCWGFFFPTCPRKTPIKATSNAFFFSTWCSLALSHRKQLTTTSLQRNMLKVPGKVTPSKLWLDLFPNVSSCRLWGNVTPSKLWLHQLPNVKFCRLPGKLTRFQTLVEGITKNQILQTVWPSHMF